MQIREESPYFYRDRIFSRALRRTHVEVASAIFRNPLVPFSYPTIESESNCKEIEKTVRILLRAYVRPKFVARFIKIVLARRSDS